MNRARDSAAIYNHPWKKRILAYLWSVDTGENRSDGRLTSDTIIVHLKGSKVQPKNNINNQWVGFHVD